MKIQQPQPSLLSRLCLLAVALILPVAAHAADQFGVPNYIDYQGKLLDDVGTPLANGDTPALYDVEFRLWDQGESGTVIWAERQLVTVLKGQFSVRLGEGTTITGAGNADIGLVGHDSPGLIGAFLGNQRYLGITVKSGTAPAEISPRLSFLTVPFAMVAQTATKLVQADGTFSQLRVGSVAYSTATVTQDLTLSGDDRTNLIDGTAAIINITLPLSGAQKELLIAKKDSSANQVIVNPPANGTINGGTGSIRLKVKGESVTLQNTGGNDWWVVNEARDKTPVGTIVSFAGDGPVPAGYLSCDGTSLLRTDHPDLFAAIGTAWGSSNVAKNAVDTARFNLPNTYGRFLRALDEGVTKADQDVANRFSLYPGGFAGAKVGSYQDDETKAHNHSGNTDNDGAHSHSVNLSLKLVNTQSGNDGWNGGGFKTSDRDLITTNAPIEMSASVPQGGAHSHHFTTNNTGGTETRPYNVAVRFCIKY